MNVDKFGGCLKWGYPYIIRFNRMFPYHKPSILGIPHLWKPPYEYRIGRGLVTSNIPRYPIHTVADLCANQVQKKRLPSSRLAMNFTLSSSMEYGKYGKNRETLPYDIAKQYCFVFFFSKYRCSHKHENSSRRWSRNDEQRSMKTWRNIVISPSTSGVLPIKQSNNWWFV